MRKNRKRKVTFIIDDLPDFIEKNATTVKLMDQERERTFYHLPHWFEFVGGSWVIHHINDLPEPLKKAISDIRLGKDTDKILFDCPEYKKSEDEEKS